MGVHEPLAEAWKRRRRQDQVGQRCLAARVGASILAHKPALCHSFHHKPVRISSILLNSGRIRSVAKYWNVALSYSFAAPFVRLSDITVLADISLAVPISNSCTFMWTSLTGVLLGEETMNLTTCIGSLFVVLGVGICVHSKLESK